MPNPASKPALRLAFYGDDFTGSTDTLATLSEAGLRATLFLKVPSPEDLLSAGPLDALGIAGAARSMAPEAMRAELEPVGRFLASTGAPVIHYKTCSTFDSAPHVGSIGVAVDVLRRVVPNPMVAIVGGQPNLGRFCIFSNLFASVGSGGPVVRIDRHPTMRAHPVTPMLEADLRVHFAAQGLPQVIGVDATTYELADAAQEAAVVQVLAGGPDAVLFDVGRQSHLAAIGRLVCMHARKSPLLMVGPSGATQALLEHWRTVQTQAPSALNRIAPAAGPVFALAGSLSPITARQLEAAQSYVRQPLDVQRVVANDATYVDAWVQRTSDCLRAGQSALAYMSRRGDADGTPRAAQALAERCGAIVARLLPEVPVRRVGIAGGDTSSHVMKALDIEALTHVGILAPGVAMCRAQSRAPHLDGMEFMLKGGQMGPADLFERLLTGT